MQGRQSIDNRTNKQFQQKRIMDKQNHQRTPTQPLSKSKKKDLQNSNSNMLNRQTDRSKGVSNRLLNTNISPNKLVSNPIQKFVAYPKITQQNNSTLQQRFCQNHYGKIAKYKIISDEEILNYCQKCSIFLASQGFSVSKIEIAASISIDPDTSFNPNRTKTEGKQKQTTQNEVQLHLNYVMKNLQERQEDIKRKINEAQNYRKQIENNLQIYFRKIIDYILDKKKQFLGFIQNEHNNLLQKYQEQQTELQKAIMQSFRMRAQLVDTQLQQSQKSFYKNQIKKFRIMCEKMEIQKSEKKDIVTVDLQQIVDTINQKFKIKVNNIDLQDDRGFSGQEIKQKLRSIGESQINKINDKCSLFSSIDNFD